MNVPDGADVRAWTPITVDWSDYGYDEADDDPLDQPAAMAASTFSIITGHSWATIESSLDTVSPPLTDTDLLPVVQRIVAGLTLMQVAQSQPDYLETLADFDLIQSFSAGAYSETRRSPGDALKARMLVAWPWLSDALWSIMTPDKYDEWVERITGVPRPASAVTEVAWNAYGWADAEWGVRDGGY